MIDLGKKVMAVFYFCIGLGAFLFLILSFARGAAATLSSMLGGPPCAGF